MKLPTVQLGTIDAAMRVIPRLDDVVQGRADECRLDRADCDALVQFVSELLLEVGFTPRQASAMRRPAAFRELPGQRLLRAVR